MIDVLFAKQKENPKDVIVYYDPKGKITTILNKTSLFKKFERAGITIKPMPQKPQEVADKEKKLFFSSSQSSVPDIVIQKGNVFTDMIELKIMDFNESIKNGRLREELNMYKFWAANWFKGAVPKVLVRFVDTIDQGYDYRSLTPMWEILKFIADMNDIHPGIYFKAFTKIDGLINEIYTIAKNPHGSPSRYIPYLDEIPLDKGFVKSIAELQDGISRELAVAISESWYEDMPPNEIAEVMRSFYGRNAEAKAAEFYEKLQRTWKREKTDIK